MYMSASEAAARGVSSLAGVIRGGSGVPPSHAPSPPQSAAAHAHAYRVELERNNNPLAHFADLAVAKAEEDRDRRGSVEMYMDKRKMAVQQQQQQESHRSVAQLPSPTASMHRGHPAHPQALVAQHNSQSPYLSGLPPGSVFRDQPSPRGDKYAPQPPSALSHKGPPTSVSSPYMNIPAVKYGTVPAPEKYKGPSPNSAVLDRREAYPRGVESVEIRKIPSGYGPPHGPPHPSEAYPRSSSAERPPSRGGKPSSRGPPDDGRQGLTAANLIDHIITRSMNQDAPSPHESMRGPPHSGLHHLPPPTSRPSPVPLMQPGVMTNHPHHGITQQQMAQMIAAEQHHRDRDRAMALTMAQAQQQHREQQQRESNERERERAAHEAAAERHRQEIMSRYHRKPYDHGPPSSGGPHGSVQADERQIIRIAQGGGPPPPGPHHGIAPPSSPRVSLSRSSPIVSHGGGPDAMSPPCQGRPPSGANPLVSYVTNKIAEAMRTDRTDDKGPGDSHHQRPPSNDSHHHRKEEHQPPTSAPLPPHKRRTPPYGYEHHPLPVSSAGPPIRHPYPMYPTYPPGRHPGLPPIPTSNAHHPPMPPHSHAPPLPPTSQAYKAQYEPLSDSD
ncbi:unnamed protein product [Cyprideis torosa]|uniref:Uncharacterized protein n=1 Tax=Cyprideis torosa TaxID=163714 RepID=A0A7R8ZVB8_9CRUS|nr:unnamed protein product [Cyprideis torosa]CAG0902790.1 unnamed protein product [Cyprideis torosa]